MGETCKMIKALNKLISINFSLYSNQLSELELGNKITILYDFQSSIINISH